jgi:hypothetical protein
MGKAGNTAGARWDLCRAVVRDLHRSQIVTGVEGAEARAIAGMRRFLASGNVFIGEPTPNHIENIAGIPATIS